VFESLGVLVCRVHVSSSPQIASCCGNIDVELWCRSASDVIDAFDVIAMIAAK